MVEAFIVILTHNQLAYTMRLVESIRERAGSPAYELIFVDQGSTDGTLEWLATLEGAKVTVSAGEAFVFNHSLNVGIALAEGQVLVCANNDVEILTQDFLEPITSTLEQSPLIGVLGVQINATPRDLETNPTGHFPLTIHRGWVPGCFFALHRTVWEALGEEFCELYRGYGCEEADLAMRLLDLGYLPAVLGHVSCFHVGGATYGTGHVLTAACRENALVFAQKYGYPLDLGEEDFWSSLYYYWQDVFLKAWTLKKTRLDLGCGDGRPEGHVGIDRIAGPKIDLVWDLNYGLPFPDNSVDQVRAYSILEELADVGAMITEVYRVLKPQGILDVKVMSGYERSLWPVLSVAHHSLHVESRAVTLDASGLSHTCIRLQRVT